MKTSIDHLPEEMQRDIETIVTLLRDEVDTYIEKKSSIPDNNGIVKIILFGSHAKGSWVNDPENGYTSDYDILLLLNSETLIEEYQLWSKVEEKIQRRISAPLGLIIHSIEDVSNRLMQGHYFFSDIRQQGIELYSCNKKALRKPGNLTSVEQRNIAEKHYEQWFKSASDFLDTYGYDRSKGRLNKSAFELHQATERYYATTLLVFTNYKPKTHNIEQLRSFCAEHHEEYRNTFPGNSRFNRRAFQRLKRAYIESRYSEHFEITEEELTWLSGQVKILQQLTETCCLKKIAEFDIAL